MTYDKNTLTQKQRTARLALLADVGISLYGNRWHNPLADRLGVRPRTLRRWLSGQWDITDEVMTQLLELGLDQKSNSSSSSAAS